MYACVCLLIRLPTRLGLPAITVAIVIAIAIATTTTTTTTTATTTEITTGQQPQTMSIVGSVARSFRHG